MKSSDASVRVVPIAAGSPYSPEKGSVFHYQEHPSTSLCSHESLPTFEDIDAIIPSPTLLRVWLASSSHSSAPCFLSTPAHTVAATRTESRSTVKIGRQSTWQACRRPFFPHDPTNRLIEEHHINNFDAGAFFSLHDFDSDGHWDPSEIERFYGLDDPSISSTVSSSKRKEVVDQVLSIFDPSKSGVVTRGDWLSLSAQGVRLPDFGFGPGHHGDDEYEYEIHHFEKFHDENTREEDLTHPEDIEHFRKHEHLEDEEERIGKMMQRPVVEENIPTKFRKGLRRRR